LLKRIPASLHVNKPPQSPKANYNFTGFGAGPSTVLYYICYLSKFFLWSDQQWMSVSFRCKI